MYILYFDDFMAEKIQDYKSFIRIVKNKGVVLVDIHFENIIVDKGLNFIQVQDNDWIIKAYNVMD